MRECSILAIKIKINQAIKIKINETMFIQIITRPYLCSKKNCLNTYLSNLYSKAQNTEQPQLLSVFRSLRFAY